MFEFKLYYLETPDLDGAVRRRRDEEIFLVWVRLQRCHSLVMPGELVYHLLLIEATKLPCD